VEFDGRVSEKELADWTKQMAILGGHGASQGFSDEAIAGIKTGSLSSPEYVTERDILRDEMQKRKEEMGIPGVLAEAGGSVLTTMAVPVLKGELQWLPVIPVLVGLPGNASYRHLCE
jgi:hypothetical protein